MKNFVFIQHTKVDVEICYTIYKVVQIARLGYCVDFSKTRPFEIEAVKKETEMVKLVVVVVAVVVVVIHVSKVAVVMPNDLKHSLFVRGCELA